MATKKDEGKLPIFVGQRPPVWNGVRYVPDPRGPFTLSDVMNTKKKSKS